jgi:hypothetical protein
LVGALAGSTSFEAISLKLFGSSPSFPHKNGILNSNLYTENAYGACNQHVFGILGEQILGTRRKNAFEYIYIAHDDISIYMKLIHFI